MTRHEPGNSFFFLLDATHSSDISRVFAYIGNRVLRTRLVQESFRNPNSTLKNNRYGYRSRVDPAVNALESDTSVRPRSVFRAPGPATGQLTSDTRCASCTRIVLVCAPSNKTTYVSTMRPRACLEFRADFPTVYVHDPRSTSSVTASCRRKNPVVFRPGDAFQLRRNSSEKSRPEF